MEAILRMEDGGTQESSPKWVADPRAEAACFKEPDAHSLHRPTRPFQMGVHTGAALPRATWPFSLSLVVLK